MQSKGALCTFSLPPGQAGALELRITTVDAVGFLTTVGHMKSRLRADYPGQPAEAWQTLSHQGTVLDDSRKLSDIISELPSVFSPLHFEGKEAALYRPR